MDHSGLDKSKGLCTVAEAQPKAEFPTKLVKNILLICSM